MFNEINLAIKNERRIPQKEQLQRIKLFSFLALFIVASLSVVIFLVNLKFSTASIKQQESREIQNLALYNDTVGKIYILNSRLSDISTILAKRNDLSQNVEQIIALGGSGVSVDQFELDQNKVLVLSISASSLGDINVFLNKVLKLSDSGNFGDVLLTSLTTDPDKGFIVNLSISLK